MISEELFGQTNLPGAQIVYIHEAANIIIIGEYKNFVFATFEILLPCFENVNNS